MLLEITGFSKRFGGLVAVSNVDLSLEAGEIRGIIGPNGSGKSTLFNLISGVYFSFCMLRSNIGRAFKALREDPLAAAATGINVRKYKLLAFIISALYAGAAGSLAAHMTPGFVHPNSYTLVEMVTVLLMVVLGGIGHIWGGIIGAIIVTIIYDLTRDYYQYQLLMFGMVIVLTVMYMPTGIGGLIDRYFVTRGFVAIWKANKNAA